MQCGNRYLNDNQRTIVDLRTVCIGMIKLEFISTIKLESIFKNMIMDFNNLVESRVFSHAFHSSENIT